MTEGQDLWTKKDVAKFLGNISVRSVERMDIPRVNVMGTGRKPIVRYDPDEVRAWVEKRKSRTLLKKSA